MLSKTNANDGQTKSMHFLIKNDDLSKAYNNNWHKISADIKKLIANLSIIQKIL